MKFLFYFASWLWACFHAQAFQTFSFILLTLKNFAGTLSHSIHAWNIHKIWHFESVFIAPCRKYEHKKRAGRWIVLIGRFSKKTFKFCGPSPHCPIGRVAPKKRKQKVPPAEVNRSTTQSRSRLDISELSSLQSSYLLFHSNTTAFQRPCPNYKVLSERCQLQSLAAAPWSWSPRWSAWRSRSPRWCWTRGQGSPPEWGRSVTRVASLSRRPSPESPKSLVITGEVTFTNFGTEFCASILATKRAFLSKLLNVNWGRDDDLRQRCRQFDLDGGGFVKDKCILPSN